MSQYAAQEHVLEHEVQDQDSWAHTRSTMSYRQPIDNKLKHTSHKYKTITITITMSIYIYRRCYDIDDGDGEAVHVEHS